MTTLPGDHACISGFSASVHSNMILVPNMCVCDVGARFLDFSNVMYVMYAMHVMHVMHVMHLMYVMYVVYVMYVFDFLLDFRISMPWINVLQLLIFHWISQVDDAMM